MPISNNKYFGFYEMRLGFFTISLELLLVRWLVEFWFWLVDSVISVELCRLVLSSWKHSGMFKQY